MAIGGSFWFDSGLQQRPIDAKTLRKHYRSELDTGAVKATAKVAEFIYRKATTEGPQCVTGAIFWLKTRGQWKETSKQGGHPPTTP